MGAESKIEWTHHTFNPWIGCTRIHTGCVNCYAEAQNKRWAHNGGGWGPGATRKVTADANWKQPMKWARAALAAGERHRVFCASLADVLDDEAPRAAQERLWNLIRNTASGCSTFLRGEGCRIDAPQGMDGGDCAECGAPFMGLDWLLLTKRPQSWERIPEDVRPLVWLGTSISDQHTADEFVPRLLAAKGFAVKFLSAEPLVGPIDLAALRSGRLDALRGDRKTPEGEIFAGGHGVDWVIVGGESGPGARRCELGWIASVVNQCGAAKVPCFVKQLGAHAVYAERRENVHQEGTLPGGGSFRFQMASFESSGPVPLTDKKGGDPSEWPDHLRVRQFPGVRR